MLNVSSRQSPLAVDSRIWHNNGVHRIGGDLNHLGRDLNNFGGGNLLGTDLNNFGDNVSRNTPISSLNHHRKVKTEAHELVADFSSLHPHSQTISHETID